MSKKEKVKDVIRSTVSDKGKASINNIYRWCNGKNYGSSIRWENANMEVSRSTIYRAFIELLECGDYEAYYEYGHCFDEMIIRLK